MGRPATPYVTVDALLEPGDCWQLLTSCRAGMLACTMRAVPTVLPVTMTALRSHLFLWLADPAQADRLNGQVVALGVGEAPTPRHDGWWVVARGLLTTVGHGSAQLVLDVQEVEGSRVSSSPYPGTMSC